MEFRDAIRIMRKEAGVTQSELAAALRINYTTIGRWEMGKTFPNRSAFSAVYQFATEHNASEECLKILRSSMDVARKERSSQKGNSLYTVEHDTLSRLIHEAVVPIYVSDSKTDELLYMNLSAEELFCMKLSENSGKKCYECIMHRDSPCIDCKRDTLVYEKFHGMDTFLQIDQAFHRIESRLTRWKGHEARIHYVTNLDGAVKIAEQRELEKTYHEQIYLRKEISKSAFASAHYNLTRNTIISYDCAITQWKNDLEKSNVDEMLQIIQKNTVWDCEKEKLRCVRDRQSIIKLYYQGTPHISFRYFNTKLQGYFETSFDLMQNPTTMDIEAFVMLRDITNEVLSNEIIEVLLRTDYESIFTIDAQTGEAYPYMGERIRSILEMQKRLNNNSAGVEKFLRERCADSNIDYIINETKLETVKEKLEQNNQYSILIQVRSEGKVKQKRVRYAYLDKTQRLILCAIRVLRESE